MSKTPTNGELPVELLAELPDDRLQRAVVVVLVHVVDLVVVLRVHAQLLELRQVRLLRRARDDGQS